MSSLNRPDDEGRREEERSVGGTIDALWRRRVFRQAGRIGVQEFESFFTLYRAGINLTIYMIYNMTIMTTVNIAEAKSRLADYLRRVEGGETVTIARRNQPIAELRPLKQPPRKHRPVGLCAGDLIVPDDFDEPLPTSMLDGFEGA